MDEKVSLLRELGFSEEFLVSIENFNPSLILLEPMASEMALVESIDTNELQQITQTEMATNEMTMIVED